MPDISYKIFNNSFSDHACSQKTQSSDLKNVINVNYCTKYNSTSWSYHTLGTWPSKRLAILSFWHSIVCYNSYTSSYQQYSWTDYYAASTEQKWPLAIYSQHTLQYITNRYKCMLGYRLQHSMVVSAAVEIDSKTMPGSCCIYTIHLSNFCLGFYFLKFFPVSSSVPQINLTMCQAF